MNLQASKSDAEAEGEWQIVTPDWWCTSFSSVHWAHHEMNDSKPRIARPPFYQYRHPISGSGSEFSDWDAYSGTPKGRRNEAQEMLNPDLVGVRGAEEVLSRYEKDVGFHYVSFPKFEPEDFGLRPSANICTEIDEEEILANRGRWEQMMNELINGVPEALTADSDESLGDYSSPSSSASFQRCTSAISSVDLTSSERSDDFFAMPSTPKAKASYANILLKNVSPSSSIASIAECQPFSPFPTKPLNAAASTFVPSFSPVAKTDPVRFPSHSETSPVAVSFVNFTFPTLNAPMVKIKKDEQGFFTDVQVENPSTASSQSTERSPTALLSPFVQPRRKVRISRTREMVDRLRSQTSPRDDLSSLDIGHSTSKCVSHSPSPIFHDMSFVQPRLSVSENGGDRLSATSTPSNGDDENDGWIDVGQPRTTSSAAKRSRTRDLFLALTRRRNDSLCSENAKEPSASNSDDAGDCSPQYRGGSPLSSPPTSPLSMQNDGWIEGSSSVSPSGTQVNSLPPLPATTPNIAHPTKKPLSSTPTANAHLSMNTIPSYMPVHPHPQHMIPRGPLPFFFPAYPNVAVPVPFPAAAFMHIPASPYPVGMHHMHGPPPGSVMPSYVNPALMAVRGPSLKTTAPSMNFRT
ncbi:hypothetical protein K443DRAFT_96859 [Laccaria amethystina LaAM-08-1]|uniref:Uncharacterized protein n=1 Tax=Laccaria amethystina LaAM-08-1 TaxID=1095629 RepID=A0A0C9XXU1_9AGAR|nr:hypothetical protein K443DRAFT_96859 [Laccaria amethystina LaAM-08-1]